MMLRWIVIAFSLLMTPIFAADELSDIDIDMTVVKVPIVQQSVDEAADYLRKRTQELGIQEIIHNFLYKEYQAQGLSNIRRTEVFQFYDAKVAQALIESDIHFVILMPCRVGLVEDEQGKGWFVMINQNLFRSTMASIPPDIRKSAQICDRLMEIIGVSPATLPTNIPSLDIAQTLIKMPIAEDVSRDDAIGSLKLRANDLNLKLARHHVLMDEHNTPETSNIKFVQIFQFCDAIVSQKMLQQNISYIAYMPCQIALVENKQGKRWLMMKNMDIFIHLGHFSPKLNAQFLEIHHKLMEIMTAAANGDF